MPHGRFGFNETSPDKLQLDAGEAWANFDIEAFLEDAQDPETDVTDLSTYGLGDTTEATMLGASEGGGEFNANRDIKEMDYDGAPGRTKGMRRREPGGVNPEFSIDLLEFTEENLKLAIAGSQVNDVEAEGTGEITDVVEITGGEITVDAYIDNIVFIGKRADGKPIIFEVRNCLAEGDFAVDTDSGEEAPVSITFQAHFDVEECTVDEYGAKEWVEPWRVVMYADNAA